MSTEDEIFALKFELKSLTDLTVRREAERWVPGFIWPNNEEEHMSRYKLASTYANGKQVLDIACGSGYGSFLMATEGNASFVTGYDLDSEAIRYGNLRYKAPNVERRVGDALAQLPEAKYDLAVSFETIEHLSDYDGFLKNLKSALKSDGTLIISTPIVEQTTRNCVNPYHTIEWSFSDFHSLVGKHFSVSKIFVQGLIFKEPERDIIQRITGRLKKILGIVPDIKAPVRTSLQPQFYTPGPGSIVEGYQILVCKKL